MSRPALMLAVLVALSSAATAGENAPASVGVARMLPDGNILVGVPGPGSNPESGARAEGVILVEQGDSNYQRLLDHIGGLKPGETKLIPPWPDPPSPAPQQDSAPPPPENGTPAPQR